MKLSNIDQKWFDENRRRFHAETYSLNIDNLPTCKHEFYRKSPIEIACRRCHNVWRDMGKIKI